MYVLPRWASSEQQQQQHLRWCLPKTQIIFAQNGLECVILPSEVAKNKDGGARVINCTSL